MSNQSANKSNQQFTRKKIEQFSYGLSDIIGKGYSSQVYKGRHDHTQQPVAIKVIDMKMLKNEINRHLLESQIEILKQIKNVPNVLRFHEVYTTKNNTYIVTELCSSDLNKKVKEKLTEDQAYYFMDQVVQGYLEVYGKEIVHRDLKPANILLTENDECKIADFGFSIKNQELSKPSKYNVGSPLYMAPQSLKNNQYSYQTDLWSLGVIFFQLLTGDTPWKSKTQKDLLRKMQVEKIQILIQRRKLNFSSKTVDFLVRCLSIDKSKRLNPEQLRRYKFRNVVPNNILTQAKLNLPNNSQQKLSIKPLNTSLKSPSNKLFQRKNLNTLRTPTSKNNPSQNTSFNNTLTQNKPSQNCFPSYNTNKNTQKTQHQKEQIRMVSKQLISEIHFCRFLFKLIQKIKESQSKGILRSCKDEECLKVERKFTQFIRHKIGRLVTFGSSNFLEIDQTTYQQYKECSDFKKILKISKEYHERYQSELNQAPWNTQFNMNFTTCQTLSLIKKMTLMLDEKKDQVENDIGRYEKDIVILDYLITVKKLLEILKDGENYEKFSRKSKIEDIVEGTTIGINFELYEKILQRAKQMVGC